MPQAFDRSNHRPEITAFAGETDVFCGVPADAVDTDALQVLDESPGTLLNFLALGVDIAVIAKLVVGNGMTAGVVNPSVIALTVALAPP